MTRVKIIISASLLFFLLSIIGCFCLHFIHSPLNNLNEVVIYTLKPGTSSSQMLRQLRSQKIINAIQTKLLRCFIYFQGSQKKLKAGEYQIPLNISPKVLIDKFVKGEVIQYSFTILEGSTFRQIMASLAASPKIIQTLQGKSSQEIMLLLGANSFLEGQFFPETYFYTANTLDIDLLKRAHQLMQKNLQQAWSLRALNIQLSSPDEALILASIIEKEVALDEERPLVSGVFHQRLIKNMYLQADPTVIYGLDDQYAGKLSHAQLKKDTPYNTYLHKGLPPTPIANPGIKAIIAALHPIQNETLYFVAKGDGTHSFSITLKEHNKMVSLYQRNRSAFSAPCRVAPFAQKHLKHMYQIGDGL